MLPRSPEEIVAYFDDRELDDELRHYVRYHARRFAGILDYLEPLLADLERRAGGRTVTALDIGPGFQTELLRERLPGARVDTLGYPGPFPAQPPAVHHEFDLNASADRARRPALAGYDLILFLETIEHLYVPPRAMLGYLGSALSPGGYLVVGTPNAVALHKRLRMLAGRPPVAPMPDDSYGEAHLHEYTWGELVAAGERAGLQVHHVEGVNHFGTGTLARIYGEVGRLLPRNLRHGIMITFRRGG